MVDPVVRYFFFRKEGVRQSSIVGCCAYRQYNDRRDNDKSYVIEYAVSALNEHYDRFNRHTARSMAKDRLERKALYIEPVVDDSRWNRFKMWLGLTKQSFKPSHPLFEVRRVINGTNAWRSILKDVVSLSSEEFPTNLRKAARKMLKAAVASSSTNVRSLEITEPYKPFHIMDVVA